MVVGVVIVGFCSVEEKPLGPLQAYVAPDMVLAVSVKVVPAQIGELLVAVGATGMAFTVADTVPAGPGQPLTVAVTE